MQLELTRQGERLTAALIGELDHHAAGDIRQRIDTAALSARCKRLVLNLERLSFMDSSGVGLIMGRYRLMLSLGGSLTVENADQRIGRMLRLAGLDRLPIWNETQERNESCETH